MRDDGTLLIIDVFMEVFFVLNVGKVSGHRPTPLFLGRLRRRQMRLKSRLLVPSVVP